MDSRERLLKTIRFEKADYMPGAFWWDGEWSKYHTEAEINDLGRELISDWVHFSLPGRAYKPLSCNRAEDAWGCVWQTEISGICGQVVVNPIDDYSKLNDYNTPLHELDMPLDELKAKIKNARDKARLIGWMQLYERMRYLRPAEELFCDIALDDPNLYLLRDRVMEYLHRELDIYLALDVDIIVFSEDWGTQKSLQISPASWRKIFKPAYRELFDRVHNAGKMVQFHSCGYIREIMEDLVELGVDMVHCMVGIMDMDELYESFHGRICFCADFNRQKMPVESADWVYNEVYRIYNSLGKNQDGGLYIVAELAGETPLENVRAYIKAIKEIQFLT
jgi:uroporphyrinogen decarboxylase